MTSAKIKKVDHRSSAGRVGESTWNNKHSLYNIQKQIHPPRRSNQLKSMLCQSTFIIEFVEINQGAGVSVLLSGRQKFITACGGCVS